jgi:hypothetical protein
MSSCALFAHCKARVSNTARVLGDEAADAFGDTSELEHLYELIHNPDSADPAEEIMLAARLREALAALGIEADTARERVSV